MALARMARPPFHMLHGKDTDEKPMECGKTVLWFVPKSLRAKLGQRWRYGIFLGRSMNSDQNILGIHGGGVIRARAIIRLIPAARWDAERILGVKVTPLSREHAAA